MHGSIYTSGRREVTIRRTQERGFLTGPDGMSFYYERDDLPEPRGAVLLLHGYAEHCGRYSGVADRLAEAGFSTWRFDYRGHGQSGGRRGHVYRFEDFFQEIRLFRDKFFEQYSKVPRFLSGHSHGGLLTLTFAATEPDGFKGLTLSSPFVGFGLKVPAWKATAARALSKVMPTLALPTEIDPKLLSHDAEVVRAYGTDKLVGTHATARWFTEVLRVHAELPATAARVKLPILVQQGAADGIASPPATRAVYEAVGSADKTLREYPGLFHEIYFELQRDETVGDLVRWLEAHV